MMGMNNVGRVTLVHGPDTRNPAAMDWLLMHAFVRQLTDGLVFGTNLAKMARLGTQDGGFGGCRAGKSSVQPCGDAQCNGYVGRVCSTVTSKFVKV
jgi:hypothetical protein